MKRQSRITNKLCYIEPGVSVSKMKCQKCGNNFVPEKKDGKEDGTSVCVNCKYGTLIGVIADEQTRKKTSQVTLMDKNASYKKATGDAK